MRKRYGEPFTLRTRPVGPLVVVSDRDSVHQVLTGDPRTYEAGRANGRILPILECGSLLVSDGEEHRQRRHLLMPSFRAAAVDRLGDFVVAQTQRAMQRWPVDRRFPLLPSMRSITLEVILRAVISLPDPASHRRLAASVTGMLSPAASAALWLERDRRPWWSPANVFEHRRRTVRALVGEELARRRRLRDGRGRDDVLDVLMAGSGPDGAALDDRSISDEVVTLLMAGYETTSIALAWAFERMVRNRAVLDRVRADVSGGDTAYVGALIRESLRIRPPLIDAVRAVSKPVTLGGRDIPAGAVVMVSIPLVHHRRGIYPCPEELRPERFLEGHPRATDWVPFGGGPRRCIGADLAMLEMTKVIETVLSVAQLRPDRLKAESCRLYGTTLQPSRGASVVLDGRAGGGRTDRP